MDERPTPLELFIMYITRQSSMARTVRYTGCFLFALFLTAPLFAQATKAPPEYAVKIRTDREDAVYRKGENVHFQVQLLQKGKALADQQLTYTVEGDGGYRRTGTVQSAEKAVPIQAVLDRPGMIRCTVQWRGENGKTASAYGGAAVAPLEIKAARAEPADFDAFWAEQKKRLAAIPMNPKLVPFQVEKYKAEGLEVYDIKVDCVDDIPVSGYLAKPIGAKKQSLPIIISYHGAGVRSAGVPSTYAKKGALALDINAHGILNGQPKKYYEDLQKGKLENYSRKPGSEKYFLGMFLRVVRSLEFMKSLPEWDGKTIAVSGSSQGGGQALAAAGLDPDVTICCAYVPAKCYHTGFLDKEFGGWPGYLKAAPDREISPETLRLVQYVDAATLSKRSKATSLLTVGYIDITCSPTSVYVAYNNIKAPKRILPFPLMGHSTPAAVRAQGDAFIWENIQKASSEKPR